MVARKAEGAPLEMTQFATDRDYLFDFNGMAKGGLTFRVQYAGAGANPGWKLAADTKGGSVASSVPDGGRVNDASVSHDASRGVAAGSPGQEDASSGEGGDARAVRTAPGGASAGCACRAGDLGHVETWPLILTGFAWFMLRPLHKWRTRVVPKPPAPSLRLSRLKVAGEPRREKAFL